MSGPTPKEAKQIERIRFDMFYQSWKDRIGIPRERLGEPIHAGERPVLKTSEDCRLLFLTCLAVSTAEITNFVAAKKYIKLNPKRAIQMTAKLPIYQQQSTDGYDYDTEMEEEQIPSILNADIGE